MIDTAREACDVPMTARRPGALMIRPHTPMTVCDWCGQRVVANGCFEVTMIRGGEVPDLVCPTCLSDLRRAMEEHVSW